MGYWIGGGLDRMWISDNDAQVIRDQNFLAGGDEDQKAQTQIVLRALLLEAREDKDGIGRVRYLVACERAIYKELAWSEWIDD